MTVGRLTWGLYAVGLLMVAAFIGVAVLGQNNVSTIYASLEQGVSPLDLSNFDETPDVEVQLVCVLQPGMVPPSSGPGSLNAAQMAAVQATYPFDTATVPGLAWLTETGIYEMFPLPPQLAEIQPSTSTGPCIPLAQKPTLMQQGRSQADGFFYLIRTTQIPQKETCCGPEPVKVP